MIKCKGFIIIIAVSMLLLSPVTEFESPHNGGPGSHGHEAYESAGCDGFDVENITFKDACYNGTEILHPLEWWYFDAISGHYSMEFHIDIASAGVAGTAVPMLNVYRDGRIVIHEQKYLPLSEFNASKERPAVFISGKKVISSKVDQSGNWIFRLSVSMGDCAINLTFSSNTQGWKSKILNMWWWGVIQPKASVNGTIRIADSEVRINGTGYQEHGWDGIFPYVKGWYWGKFVGGKLNIIWTDIIKYPWEQHLMMMLNVDGGGYINIPSGSIRISLSNLNNDNIPTSFSFNAECETAKVNVNAYAITITHQFSIGLFDYWRYHVHVKGTIQYGETVEQVDNIQIMDFTRVW